MFKSQIITDNTYWSNRKKWAVYSILVLVSFVAMEIFLDMPVWLEAIVMLPYIGFIYFRLNVAENLKKNLTGDSIKIDLNKIELLNSKKEVLLEFIPTIMDRIIVTGNFTVGYEDVEPPINELLDDYRNTITIEKDGNIFEYDFKIGSHYMAVQLQKVLNHWKTQLVNLELNPNKSTI